MAEQEDGRPDPDALLAQVQKEEAKARKGRLKIFFGAAPGVGKTYAMLLAAQQERAKGVEVLMGVVETHGRDETSALTEGLSLLPRRAIPYKGVVLEEFDVDAALARRPALLLVDELAHSNAPGSRHKKRWQDVEELLDAGLSVYTTLNVQHLESVNEAVQRITGVQVRETVPDRILQEADAIALVDISDEDLLQRLKEGKVYLGDRGQRAMGHFFRKSNLIALRQLAMRLAADRVDLELQQYRSHNPLDEGRGGGRDRLLVAVGGHPEDEQLIRTTYHLATALRATWLAVHVDTPDGLIKQPQAHAWVWNHLHLAESLGAETVRLTGIHAAREILAYANLRDVTQIIVGQPLGLKKFLWLWPGSPLARILSSERWVDVLVHPLQRKTARNEDRQTANRRYLGIGISSEQRRQRLWHYVISAGIGIGLSGMAWYLGTARIGMADAFMLYLLGAVGTALVYGRWPSILTLAAAITSYYAFGLSTGLPNTLGSLLSFAIILSLSLLISQLVARSREQEEMARLRERRVRNLYNLAQSLSTARAKEDIIQITRQQLEETLGLSVVFWLPDGEGKAGDQIHPFPPDSPLPKEGDALMAAARWSYRNKKMAGRGTDTLPDVPALFLPLPGPRFPLGLMMVGDLDIRHMPMDWQRFLETVARLVAVALESAIQFAKSRDAEVQLQVEQLHNALLGAVSHDLRTPLTSVVGAASTLQHAADLTDDERDKLIANILSESRKMSRMVGRILDMARLQSATMEIKKEWFPLEDLVAAATQRVEVLLRDHPLTANIAKDFPLLHVDGHLIEELLVNLLENAAKYTPSGAPIEIEGWDGQDGLNIRVIDHGVGVPPGREEEIFRRFSRVKPPTGEGGSGLGLAICDAIARLHGGKIRVNNRVMSRGAVFTLTLPKEAPPPNPPEEPKA